MAAVGLRYEGPSAEETAFGVWPENWQAVEVFLAMGTQWSRDMGGAVTGLRYEALPVVERRLGICRSQSAAVFHGIRIMERVAIEIMRR